MSLLLAKSRTLYHADRTYEHLVEKQAIFSLIMDVSQFLVQCGKIY